MCLTFSRVDITNVLKHLFGDWLWNSNQHQFITWTGMVPGNSWGFSDRSLYFESSLCCVALACHLISLCLGFLIHKTQSSEYTVCSKDSPYLRGFAPCLLPFKRRICYCSVLAAHPQGGKCCWCAQRKVLLRYHSRAGIDRWAALASLALSIIWISIPSGSSSVSSHPHSWPQ